MPDIGKRVAELEIRSSELENMFEDLQGELKSETKELEHKREIMGRGMNDFQDKIIEHSEKIIELEKKIFHDYGGDLNEIEDAAIIQMELVKKVLKLEEWQDKSWNMHQEMAQEILPNQLEILEKQISELKTKLEGFNKNNNTDYMLIKKADLEKVYDELRKHGCRISQIYPLWRLIEEDVNETI